VHVGYVRGYDTAQPEAGPVFQLPVTVVQPVALATCTLGQQPPCYSRNALQLSPGAMERCFVTVPQGCTWADIEVSCGTLQGEPRVFFLHAMQNLAHISYAKSELSSVLSLSMATRRKKVSLLVQAGRTLEVCLAQFWKSLGETQIDLEVTFHGVVPDHGTVTLSPSKPISCVQATVGPGAVEVKPSASLTTVRSSMRPSKATISPLGERDLFPGGRQVYELVLEYSFKLEEDGEATPQALIFNDYVYESQFESQLIQVYDAGKRYMGCTDAWPEALKLKKGSYTARLQVRHDSVPMLEKLKDIPLSLDRPLAKEIAVKAYPDFNGAVAASGDFGARKLQGGMHRAIFFALAVDEKLPDHIKPGDLLLGTVSYSGDQPKGRPEGKRGRPGFTVQYAVSVSKVEEKKPDEPKDERPASEKLAEAVLEAQLKHLGTLRKWESREEHVAMLAELLAANPSHLPLLQEAIKASQELKPPEADKPADPKEAEAAEVGQLKEELRCIEQLEAAVDTQVVAAHGGRRIDKDDEAEQRRAKELDKAKDALVEALAAKVVALARLSSLEPEKAAADSAEGAVQADGGSGQLQSAYKQLASWVDMSDAKHAATVAAYHKALGRHALALTALKKAIAKEDHPKKTQLNERVELLTALGWTAWADREKGALVVKYPESYALF